jgi:hypothetical protein
MPPWAFPYGLNTATRAYASSVSTSMSAYEELPGHHLRSALDLVASTPASEYLDSTETLARGSVRSPLATMTSPIDDLTCIYRATTLVPLTPTLPTTATIRPASASKLMGLSRRIRKPRLLPEGGNATPPHAAHPGARGGPQPFKADQGAQLAQIQELQAKLDEERERLRLLQQTLEREHVARIRGGGA